MYKHRSEINNLVVVGRTLPLPNLRSNLERISGIPLYEPGFFYCIKDLRKRGIIEKENSGKFGLTEEGKEYRPFAGLALLVSQQLGKSVYQILGTSHRDDHKFIAYEFENLREKREEDLKSVWIPRKHLGKLERIGIIEMDKRSVKLTHLGEKFVDDFLYPVYFGIKDGCLLGEIKRESERKVNEDTIRDGIRRYFGQVFKL